MSEQTPPNLGASAGAEKTFTAHRTEFFTETRKLKLGFIFLAALVFITTFFAGLYDGAMWLDALLYSGLLSLILLATVWLYASFRMFDRRYVVSADGVSLFRGEQRILHFGWPQVREISRGHLEVRALDGRRIAFNLPPPVQHKARLLLEAHFQKPAGQN